MAVEVLLARDIEKENLEAHVELCAERYRRLEEKFENLEGKIVEVSSDLSTLKSSMSKDNKVVIKTLIATAGTIIVALISTAAAVLTKMG
jgi:archaellum component FlaC